VRFPEEREIILSDTVGFIQELPPELRRAFQATLEELADSDLLLHCIDASDPRRDQKIAAVEGILADLKLLDIPCLRVYNKSDLIDPDERSALNGSNGKTSLTVSARTRDNLDAVLDGIERSVLAPTSLSYS
jgi:GTP-binding protein HflX